MAFGRSDGCWRACTWRRTSGSTRCAAVSRIMLGLISFLWRRNPRSLWRSSDMKFSSEPRSTTRRRAKGLTPVVVGFGAVIEMVKTISDFESKAGKPRSESVVCAFGIISFSTIKFNVNVRIRKASFRRPWLMLRVREEITRTARDDYIQTSLENR